MTMTLLLRIFGDTHTTEAVAMTLTLGMSFAESGEVVIFVLQGFCVAVCCSVL